MRTITVCVTQEHINNGRRGLVSCCPIALALRDRIDSCLIEVGQNAVLLNDSSLLLLPPSAFYFIHAFDKGTPVKPFNFELEVPDDLGLDGKTHLGGFA